jgi:plasmid replication initiation protein
MFAEQILERPQKELNEQTDLSFTYTPRKTSRSFTHIEFNVFPNSKG